jgi:uncharacterized protein (DUF58 family)
MSSEPLFDEDFLRRLEYWKLVSRNLKAAGMKGEHRVKQRGSGLEFADYRPYVPGDDIRAVDWASYLRLNKLLVRLFQEEGDLSVYVFLDTSASMELGDPAKFRLARQMAGALAYVALYNLDQVNVLTFRRGIDRALGTLRGNSQVVRLFHFLESLEASGETRIERAVHDYFSLRRRPGLVVMISDFLEPSWQRGLEQVGRLHHDILAIQIKGVDSGTEGMPYETLLIDAESGERRRVRVTPELMDDLEAEIEAHDEEIRSLCSRRGWSHLQASIETPIDDLLKQIFRTGHLVR